MAIDLSQLKAQFKDQLQVNAPLKSHTTLEIGGPAAGLIEAKTTDELISIIKAVKQLNLPYLVIGGGSNLLISDADLDLTVIKVQTKGIKLENYMVIAQAGETLQSLVNFTVEHSLSGMQKLTGIPGAVGGAIYGNAGAYGQTISDNLVEVTCLDPETLQTKTLNKEDCKFSYRDSDFKQTKWIILQAKFKLDPGNRQKLQNEADEILNLRLAKYKPGIKCPGSFFKNIIAQDLSPETLEKIPSEKIVYGKIPSGYLLEAVGARGQRQGNIVVADFHGNLFINLGDGTAKDFWDLASEYAHKVKDKFGISLEPEVQLINLPPIL